MIGLWNLVQTPPVQPSHYDGETERVSWKLAEAFTQYCCYMQLVCAPLPWSQWLSGKRILRSSVNFLLALEFLCNFSFSL